MIHTAGHCARREREALERGRGQGRSLASERLGAAEADARSARREARAATARIDDLVAELAAVRDAGRQLEREARSCSSWQIGRASCRERV